MAEKCNANIIQTAVYEALESEFPWIKSDGELYTYEIDADYNDRLSVDTIRRIFENQYPKEGFYQALDNSYEDYIFTLENELCEKVKKHLLQSHAFSSLLLDNKCLVDKVIQEAVIFSTPIEHFLKQRLLVNVFLDTGDGNYDFALNPHYPCFYGNRWGEPIDRKAGIVWLSKQQGYTKRQLQDALNEGDMTNPNGFLQSCRVEEANLSCSMPVVAFLVEMELRKLINLNALIQLTDAYSSNYSYIILDKKTVTGLYDPFNGGGGVLGIQLEKDVKLPIKFIRSAKPDGCDGYSICSCYGTNESIYTDTLKEIHVPKKLYQTWLEASI